MSLKKSFLCLSVLCLSASLLLLLLLFGILGLIRNSIPSGGVMILSGGSTVLPLEEPSDAQKRLLLFLELIQLFSAVLLPLCGLLVSILLFYRLKLMAPIRALRFGISRIQEQDLDFTLPSVSGDELGELCSAFEKMRSELLLANRTMWRQAEERKRLNAAFSHDLRNPIAVLKGTASLLKKGVADDQALDRLETYTLRIEQYVEAMSSIQRLEEMPVHPKAVQVTELKEELIQTAALLGPSLSLTVTVPDVPSLSLDHGLFLTVAENLIGNAARFARKRLSVRLSLKASGISLIVSDDGPGFPESLLLQGPRPFYTLSKDSSHFGMGLYGCETLLARQGGKLLLSNPPEGGASAEAFFPVSQKS